MLFRQYELGCLSHFSYLVGDESTGRAVVVDPRRDVSGYLADASAAGLRIERVIETHFHADFLSGHLELAAATGAAICYGRGAEAGFPIEHLRDGQRLTLGRVVLEVLATPGHTPESISLVVYEEADAPPWAVLTGDTLFIGDVGRPDLLAAGGYSPEGLARQLYRSLHERLLALPDGTRVYPAHGAGSACGKNLSTAGSSTIGQERATNYALAIKDAEEFVATLVRGQPVQPRYFPFAAEANHRPRPLLDEEAPPERLDLAAVRELQAGGAVLLDTRPPDRFAAAHLAGAVNVSLDGRFAEYAGDVLDASEPVVIVAEPGRETEAKVRLARIGFDRVLGFLPALDELLARRPELAARAERLTPAGLAALLASGRGRVQLVDVRNPGELEEGLIGQPRTLPLCQLLDGIAGLDRAAKTVVYCAAGVRSSAAASLLRRRGFSDVTDLAGGFAAWQVAALPTEQAAPSLTQS